MAFSSHTRGGNAAAGDANRMVGGLRIFSESDRTDLSPPALQEVPRDSPRFRVVAAVINLGLSMLETTVGTRNVTEIGRAVLANHRSFDNIYEDRPENMGWWVELFLIRVRSSFPTVILTNRMGGEGQVQRADWARGGLRMRQWDPSQAGLMKLNKMIVDNMVQAGGNAAQSHNPDELIAFERFMFLMGVTVAHEMLHLFVGFLTGYMTPNTPANVSFLPEIYNQIQRNGIEIGESGRAWEGMVFGGTVDAFESRSCPLGARQAGLLYLIDRSHMAHLLDHGCIRRNLEFNFDFPLQVTEPAIHIGQLDQQRRTMKRVRLSVLPPGLLPNRDRPVRPTVASSDLRQYRLRDAHDIQGRLFDYLCRIPRQPAYIFAAA